MQDYPTEAAPCKSKGKVSPPGLKKYKTPGGLGVVSLHEEKLPGTEVLHSEKGQMEDEANDIEEELEIVGRWETEGRRER